MTNLEQENKEIGFRIRAARKAKRLNQTEFAELLKKSLRTVQKYESGEIEVSVAVIKEIAKVLECSPSYLLGWDEENKVLAIQRLSFQGKETINKGVIHFLLINLY